MKNGGQNNQAAKTSSGRKSRSIPKAVTALTAVRELNPKDLADLQATRQGRYIQLIMNPRPDGSWRTKGEAALEAGYSESSAKDRTGTIYNSVGVSRLMPVYLASMGIDVRGEIAKTATEILKNGKDRDRLQAAKQLVDILGENAPKESNVKKVTMSVFLPERDDD